MLSPRTPFFLFRTKVSHINAARLALRNRGPTLAKLEASAPSRFCARRGTAAARMREE